jgi:hypothetical protein
MTSDENPTSDSMLEHRITRLETRVKAMKLLEKHRALLHEIEEGFAGYPRLSNAFADYQFLSAVIVTAPQVAANLRNMPHIRRAIKQLEEIIECQ